MSFGLALHYARMVFQLTTGSIERLAHSGLKFSVRLIADHQFVALDLQGDTYFIGTALMVVAYRSFDGDLAIYNVFVVAFELRRFFTYVLLEPIRHREVTRCNLERTLHHVNLSRK